MDGWPPNKPEWSGTSGASGTGETKTVTFNTLSSSTSDYKTVKAKCGNEETVDVIVCEITVSVIKFNHDTWGDSYDAISIMANYSTDISAPEWVAGSKNDPAAYKFGVTPIVQAKLTISPPVTMNATVSAEGADVIAGLDSTVVSFSSGVSDPEYVSFSSLTNIAAMQFGLGIWNVSLHWKVTDFGDCGQAVFNANTSGPHKIYTVLETPVSPILKPWVDVLELTNTLALGSPDALTAMSLLWAEFYYNGGGQYDVVNGAAQYTNSSTWVFNVTNWLGNFPSIQTVNCYDMAASLVVFGSAIGCGSQFDFIDPFGYLNCISPIGRSWTNNPFYGNATYFDSNPLVPGDYGYNPPQERRSALGNHAVCVLGGYIFDASGGQVDVDNDPDDGPPFSPWELVGTDDWSAYSSKVIDNNPSTNTGNPSIRTLGVQ